MAAGVGQDDAVTQKIALGCDRQMPAHRTSGLAEASNAGDHLTGSGLAPSCLRFLWEDRAWHEKRLVMLCALAEHELFRVTTTEHVDDQTGTAKKMLGRTFRQSTSEPCMPCDREL